MTAAMHIRDNVESITPVLDDSDKGDAILRQTPADLIGTPLLLRQFFFDQLPKSGVILRGLSEASWRLCEAFSCACLKR